MKSSKLSTRRASAAALGLTVCALALSACDPVATATATAATSGAQVASTAAAVNSAVSRAGGAVHLVDYSDNDTAASTVVLTGAIGDYGKGTTVKADGSTDPEHSSQLELTLAHGGFRITVAPLDAKLVAAFGAAGVFSQVTCSGAVSVEQQVTIVPGSGTGAYQGISGRFDLTAAIDEVDSKPTCDGTGAFLSQAVLVTGPGTVSFG